MSALPPARVAAVAAVCAALCVAAAPATATPVADAVAPDPRIGALVLPGTAMNFCSASVLDSAAGDLVLTAAHCLVGGGGVAFAPGFGGGAEPFGRWTVTQTYLDPRWIATQDPLADVAVVRVQPEGGGSGPITAAVGGGFAVRATPDPIGTGGHVSEVTVTGYPLLADGPRSCTAGLEVTGAFPTVGCGGLGDGTSGGPWLVGPAVVGVTGGLAQGGCSDGVSYSSPFGSQVVDLVARAEAHGPADVAPLALPAECGS